MQRGSKRARKKEREERERRGKEVHSEETVKKHMKQVLAALAVETRTAATLRALEVLQAPA